MTWLLALGGVATFASFLVVPGWFGRRAGEAAAEALAADAEPLYAFRVYDHAYATASDRAGALLTAVLLGCGIAAAAAGLGYVVYLGVQALV